jgi:hypothetical protein
MPKSDISEAPDSGQNSDQGLNLISMDKQTSDHPGQNENVSDFKFPGSFSIDQSKAANSPDSIEINAQYCHRAIGC